MGAERNKALVARSYTEVWNQADLVQALQAAEELHAADLVDHNPLPGQPAGIEGLKYMVGGLRQSYPDMRFDIDLLVAEDDKVIGHWTMYATNTRPLVIAGGIPATGKAVQITGIDIFRLENDKIVEMWHQEDTMAMMQQLGLIPSQPSKTDVKELTRYLIEEIINKQNLALLDEYVAPDLVDHVLPPGGPSGREGLRQFFSGVFQAFPDWKFVIEEMIAEGDKVVIRAGRQGTNLGVFMGRPPSGKFASWTGIDIFRFVDGRLVEHWANNDHLGLLQQLDMLPSPAPAR